MIRIIKGKLSCAQALLLSAACVNFLCEVYAFCLGLPLDKRCAAWRENGRDNIFGFSVAKSQKNCTGMPHFPIILHLMQSGAFVPGRQIVNTSFTRLAHLKAPRSLLSALSTPLPYASFCRKPVGQTTSPQHSATSSSVPSAECALVHSGRGARAAAQVGHTGDLEAVIRACTTVDKCVGELLQTVDEMGGRWLVASDHGNSDDMVQVRAPTPPPFFPRSYTRREYDVVQDRFLLAL